VFVVRADDPPIDTADAVICRSAPILDIDIYIDFDFDLDLDLDVDVDVDM